MQKIKTFFKSKIARLAIGAIALFIFGTNYASAEVWGANFFRRIGTALITVPSNLTIGSASNRISAIYTDLIDATTLTIGGTSASNLDMGGFQITNAGQVTATTFTATSTQGFLGNIPPGDHRLTPTFAFGDGDTGFWEDADDSLNLAVGGGWRYGWTGNRFYVNRASGATMENVTPTATTPGFSFFSDSNTGIGYGGADQLSLITGGLEQLNISTGTSTFSGGLVVSGDGITGSVTYPSLAFGDGDTGFYESIDDFIRITTGGFDRFQFTGNGFRAADSNGAGLQNETASDVNPVILPRRNDLTTGIGSGGAGQISLITGSIEALRIDASQNVGIGTSSPATLLDIFSTATTTVTYDSNSATQGSCLKMKDMDGAGYSYGTTLNGVMTWSTISCE